MERHYEEEDKNLSACETIIMKAIWSVGEDVSIPDLLDILRTRFGKDYKRTTLVTFLYKLSDKGYAKTYRKGRLSYAYAVKTEEEYKAKRLQEETEFWYGGKPADLVAALSSATKLSKNDLDEIRSIIDALDD